jgi:hypothetical protein
MPSIRSCSEGPRYGEKKLTLGGIKFNFQTHPPSSPHDATPAKVSTAVTAKIMLIIEFIFVLKKLLTKLLLRKANFQ